MRDVLSGRGKRLWAAVLVISWLVISWRVLGIIQTANPTHHAAVGAFYTMFTMGALGTAISLLGLDGFAKQIIPAWKNNQT